MGVTRTDFIIYGLKLDPNDVDIEKFESELCGAPDKEFDMIYDYMSGNYVYAGIIMAVADEYEGFGDGKEMCLPGALDLVELTHTLSNHFEIRQDDEYNIYAVSHFS